MRLVNSIIPLNICATAIVPLLLFILIGNTRVKKKILYWTKSIVILNITEHKWSLYGIISSEQRHGSLWITAMTINGFYILSFFFSIALGIDDKSKYKYLWFTGAIVILLGMFYTYTVWLF